MNRERTVTAWNGWLVLPLTILLGAAAIGLEVEFILSAVDAATGPGPVAEGPVSPGSLPQSVRQVPAHRALPNFWLLGEGLIVLAITVFSCFGYFTLQPNEARVLILFGAYRGTVRTSGWRWTNPLNTKLRVSLRLRNLQGERLKVNDKRGNPVEVATIVIWRVADTALAVFDVQQYEEFVKLQTESALRHVASSYPYDHGEEGETTLRAGMDEVASALQRELQQCVARAGVTIEQTRLTHLAYAPEIAGVMLRRQQAEAIIDARQKIVHGAVSMVQMALKDLAENKIVELDEERKATMVSNLLVVLCSDRDAQPVVNAGTLYT